MSNEMLFYGGLVVASAALLAGAFSAVILVFKWKVLSGKLDAEYGKKRR